MKILFVSQMWPGPDDPDHGAFLVPLVEALRRRGHELDLAVLTSRGGGRAKYFRLFQAARDVARRAKPDVVYAHYLVPTGLLADLASRAPLVVTAHGRDVRNIGTIRGVKTATEAVVRRSSAVIAVSHYLRRELEARVPSARGKVKVVDCGVDLERFRGGDQSEARAALGWDGDGPAYLCVGSLEERKNVVRLADAFERLDAGRLAFVGDGPLRPQLEGRSRVTLAGRVPARPGGALDPGGGRRLPAKPDRAVRAGAARGDGVRALRRCDRRRRPARVRHPGGGRARRSGAASRRSRTD